MENDGAVPETEAEIEQRLNSLSTDEDDQAARWGEDTAILATGALHKDVHVSEETPLISRPTDAHTPHGNEWPGQADFDSLPAWRRPSVSSSNISLMPYLILSFFRSFGSSRSFSFSLSLSEASSSPS